ncbi:tetratricopeptide repeat protein [Rhodococcus sp. NCIMB 12038]|uniref:tetratricopeptide repeat protein n=1 Tax=Rhodococcus sp. NCIMB 12038 TaxID=933800 RepID=UPI00117B7234|nr:tetratricopeptide repeat protein [Rhodococcus sp. NCIMB 12038]
MSDDQQPTLNEDLLDAAYAASNDADHYSDAGEHAKAAEKYRYAHQLFETCGHMRGQANSGLGRGQSLIALQRPNEAIEILNAARNQFLTHEGYPIFRGAADCDQNLASIYRQLGRLDEAIEAYRRALDTYPQNCEKERVSSASGLAIVLAATGAYGEALDVLRDAEDRCHDRIHGIEISVNIGVFYADSGRYDAAYLQLERARTSAAAEGADELAASCDTNLGYVHLRAGRADQAATAYTRAKERYEELCAAATTEESCLELRKKVANCSMNLGTAYGYAGDPERALAAYGDAMIAFNELGQLDRIADCRMNMGVEHAARDEIVATKLYQLAREHYQKAPGKARQAAGCIMNLARLDDASGRHQDAQQSHRRAAAEFRALGLYEWEARCAVNLASSVAASGERTDARAALDVLLPALLHLDAVKFQFPTAAARLSWRRTVASANRLAFELASETGDAELLAELVETTINSGTHTSTHIATDITMGIDTAAETIDSVTDDERMRPSDFGLAMLGDRIAGPIRLIAGVGLPMAPPPRLRMPSGRIALEKFHGAVRHYTPTTGQDCPDEPRTPVVDVT